MNRESSSSVSSFVLLIFIICLATLPVLGLQSNIGISSYGTINYSTSGILSLHVDGKYLKDSSGNIVILRGVAAGSELWWDYNYINENQFVYMKNWGCNSIRLHVQCYTLESICNANGEITNSEFLSRLDQLINWAEKYGLYVILNGFHPAASCSHGNVRVDCTHYMEVHWGGSTWGNWINLWKQYATRYASKSHIIYELTSEPMNCPMDVYQSRTRACIDAIRAIDSDCVIGVHAVGQTLDWDQNFKFEQSYPISRSNVLFIYHLYGYHMSDSSQAAIRSKLASFYANWMIANNRCVEATEFGCGYNDDPNVSWDSWQETWLNNFMTVSDADGYSGYTAYEWANYGWTCGKLLADWNGNPSPYGNVIKTYYLAH